MKILLVIVLFFPCFSFALSWDAVDSEEHEAIMLSLPNSDIETKLLSSIEDDCIYDEPSLKRKLDLEMLKNNIKTKYEDSITPVVIYIKTRGYKILNNSCVVLLQVDLNILGGFHAANPVLKKALKILGKEAKEKMAYGLSISLLDIILTGPKSDMQERAEREVLSAFERFHILFLRSQQVYDKRSKSE